jgi:hypothetical protein
MKKLAKFSVFPVLIILISLFALGCSDSDDDGPGPGPLGSNPALGDEAIALSDMQAYEISEEGAFTATTADCSFTKYFCNSALSLTGISAGSSIEIEGGKLSLTLGIPGDTTPMYTSVDSSGEGLTADPSAKILLVYYFLTEDESKELYYAQGENYICVFVYADKDTKFAGTSYGAAYDLNLKKGWNTALVNNATQAYTTGAPNANYVWVFGNAE